MQNPIESAVAPLITDAMARATVEAIDLISRVHAELDAAGWDAMKCAPYPRGIYDRSAFAQAKGRYQLFRMITENAPSGCVSRGMNDPEPRKPSDEREAKFIEDARNDAAAQYRAFIAKLVNKVGECEAAMLQGNHVWGYSFLTAIKADGTQEIYKTQMIVNVSKLGKLFNQWPTRKVKRAA